MFVKLWWKSFIDPPATRDICIFVPEGATLEILLRPVPSLESLTSIDLSETAKVNVHDVGFEVLTGREFATNGAERAGRFEVVAALCKKGGEKLPSLEVVAVKQMLRKSIGSIKGHAHKATFWKRALSKVMPETKHGIASWPTNNPLHISMVVDVHQASRNQRLAVLLWASEYGLVIVTCTDMVPELFLPCEGIPASHRRAEK